MNFTLPDRLKPKHKLAIKLAAYGMTYDQVAKTTGVRQDYIYQLMLHPEAAEMTGEINREMVEKLKLMRNKSIMRLEKLIDDLDPKVALQATKQVNELIDSIVPDSGTMTAQDLINQIQELEEQNPGEKSNLLEFKRPTGTDG